jgi:hypothetical protein
VDEALIVRAVPGGDVEFADRRSGAAQPLFPLARVLWFAFGVQQHGPAERAASSLSFELGEQEHTERPVVLLAATVGPVAGKSGSSGEAVPVTITCRTIFVQANLGR